MKFFTLEYDNFYFGIATWAPPSDNLFAFIKEIHCLFLGSKPLYLFLERAIFVFTHEDISNAEIELDVAGKFETTPTIDTIPNKHSLFTFDIDDESFGIEAKMDITTGPQNRENMLHTLEQFNLGRIFLGFDVIRSTL